MRRTFLFTATLLLCPISSTQADTSLGMLRLAAPDTPVRVSQRWGVSSVPVTVHNRGNTTVRLEAVRVRVLMRRTMDTKFTEVADTPPTELAIAGANSTSPPSTSIDVPPGRTLLEVRFPRAPASAYHIQEAIVTFRTVAGTDVLSQPVHATYRHPRRH